MSWRRFPLSCCLFPLHHPPMTPSHEPLPGLGSQLFGHAFLNTPCSVPWRSLLCFLCSCCPNWQHLTPSFGILTFYKQIWVVSFCRTSLESYRRGGGQTDIRSEFDLSLGQIQLQLSWSVSAAATWFSRIIQRPLVQAALIPGLASRLAASNLQQLHILIVWTTSERETIIWTFPRSSTALIWSGPSVLRCA